MERQKKEMERQKKEMERQKKEIEKQKKEMEDKIFQIKISEREDRKKLTEEGKTVSMC